MLLESRSNVEDHARSEGNMQLEEAIGARSTADRMQVVKEVVKEAADFRGSAEEGVLLTDCNSPQVSKCLGPDVDLKIARGGPHPGRCWTVANLKAPGGGPLSLKIEHRMWRSGIVCRYCFTGMFSCPFTWARSSG